MWTALLLAGAVAGGPAAPLLVKPDERAGYEARLADAAREAFTAFSGECPTAKVEHVGTQPISIGDHPDMAAAQERLKVTGCDHSSVENINVGRFGGSPPWKMAVSLPGETLADMVLQQSVLPRMLETARAAAPQGCASFRLDDVYISARPGGVGFRGEAAPDPGHMNATLPDELAAQKDQLDLTRAWAEVWPFELCGQDRTLGVLFIPQRDGKSTQFLVQEIWRAIELHGPGARPAPAPPQ
jgi:hypothetical protein